MRLLELFDQAYPFQWTRQDDDHWEAHFNMEDGSRVNLTLMSSDQEKYENDWWVEFNRGNMSKGKSETAIISGEGDAYKMFATVGAMLKSFVDQQKPDELFFTAEEDSRQKLYARLIPRLAKFLGMKLTSRVTSAYVLKKIK